MKLKHLLPLLLTAIFLTGCSFTVFSESEQRGDASETEQTNRKSQNKTQTNQVSANVKMKPAKPAGLAVCSEPDAPCHHKEKEFAEWELSFKLPAKIIANKNYESAPFYAVMLKTFDFDEDCDGGEYIEAIENERKRVQSLQLQRKVFASYNCPNMDTVSYDYAGKMSADKERVLIGHFIAIYAGETQEEAEELLQNMKDEYPKAQVKKMTAMWERIEQ